MDKSEIYETLGAAYFSECAHEAQVIHHLSILLPGAGGLVVDAGASLGQYTRAMAKAIHGGEVHAIEADPIRVEELVRNCEQWGRVSTSQITVHHKALSDRTGGIPFFVTNSNVSGGLTQRRTTSPAEWEEITVTSVTLDQLFPDRCPDFVKIDVEGAELAVLRGATRILTSGETTFLIELHDPPSGPTQSNEVRLLLRRFGYLSATFFGQAVFTKSRLLWLRLRMLQVRGDPATVARRGRTTIGRMIGR